MKIISRIQRYKWCFRSLLSSLYFNFHYLPFSQARKLPILLYKPKFRNLKGSIEIQGGVKFGMIQLGKNSVSIYPNNGIMFDLRKGKIIFKGKCLIGNNSYISTGDNSTLIFGYDFNSYTSLKLVCFDRIEFADKVLVGWDCIFMDTDLHKIKREDGTQSKGYGPIKIGSETWIANGCVILKNTRIPNKVIIAARSVLTGNIDVPEKTVIGTQHHVKVLAKDRWFDRSDPKIIYTHYNI
ncbi:MAG TPA: hypothetical protein DCS83_05190 [Prevotella sp.]|jgi:acetyltransferase-like isoleucine patch superfamily enzyme|nr:hypothetical protein [uncultured Prevotella sp.]HAT61929.1 hypothetical protein [Prevotella sp.]